MAEIEKERQIKMMNYFYCYGFGSCRGFEICLKADFKMNFGKNLKKSYKISCSDIILDCIYKTEDCSFYE